LRSPKIFRGFGWVELQKGELSELGESGELSESLDQLAQLDQLDQLDDSLFDASLSELTIDD